MEQLAAAGARPGLVVTWQLAAGSGQPTVHEVAGQRSDERNGFQPVVSSDIPCAQPAVGCRLPAAVRVAVIDPSPGQDVEAQVFAARSTITSLRAARPGVEIAVEPEAFARAGVPFDRLRPYVDAVLTRVPLPPRPTLDDLTAASLTPRGERVRAVAESVDWNHVAEFVSRRATAIEVSAARGLTAEEIVARYQVRGRRQESLVTATIGRGTTTLMLEVPGFVAPVTITARTTIYARGATVDIEQEDIRVNGAAIAGGRADRPPRLPLVEPERIATPPLQISLTDAYAYSLDGTATIDGAPAFVVAFAPRTSGRGLAHGRAWIDANDFSLRRLQITQDRLRGPIVSSEEVQDFVRVPAGEGNVDLSGRTRIYQMYEGAGHRTPMHRAIDIERYELNPPDFDVRLRAAHESSHLIIRETPEGVRYTGDGGKTIRAAVVGVLVDPNITDPLPFAGMSYVDLDVLGTGAQLNVFFGGTYGQLSWSVPSIAGTRWQLHGRAFGIAARYNDRAFLGGIERYAENVRQRPAHASAGAVGPLTARIRARLDYELDITGFDRSNTTSPAFRVPATAIVHGVVAAIEGERGAWAWRAWWNPARRQGWQAWGLPGDFDGANP